MHCARTRFFGTALAYSRVGKQINSINKLKKTSMEDTLSFLFLCATGVACYWFFFKCVDWFEKI